MKRLKLLSAAFAALMVVMVSFTAKADLSEIL